ncbi:MAG TPA: GNAT family N-acetyltransferase [Thermotogota bacterium]|nr:GNAT family N-acetyltransferase [Thermotogota bacterium]HRW91794.1 GNAT family N-acetyltransferase [Thermotogota bacterium]
MLSNEEILLRPLSAGDTEFVLSLRNHLESSAFFFSDPPLYDFQHAQWLSQVPPNNLEFIIEYRGEKAGQIRLTHVSFRHSRGEFGIVLSPAFQGKGIATQATRMFLEFVFSTFPIRKITLELFEDNAPARKLYEKMGFELEGVFKDEYLKNQRWCSVLRMALFKEKWEKRES